MPKDMPREQLLIHAEIVLKSFADLGIPAEVHFKFTCGRCGTRCTFVEPNLLREKGECHKCGWLTNVEEGGFLLQANI